MSLTVNTNIINDTDQYLLDAKNVKGTFVVVASTKERDELPVATRVTGSLCFCTADSKFYQFNGTGWVAALEAKPVVAISTTEIEELWKDNSDEPENTSAE